jgi:transcriptional regulator with XRE-family HTH domain
VPKLRDLVVFGATIRRFRKAHGLSQEGLGFAADLDRSYVGGVERGERNVSLVNLVRLSKALDVPLSDLFKDYESGNGMVKRKGRPRGR